MQQSGFEVVSESSLQQLFTFVSLSEEYSLFLQQSGVSISSQQLSVLLQQFFSSSELTADDSTTVDVLS